MAVIIKENMLTPELYCSFHTLAGFADYSHDDVEIALKRNLYSVVIYDDEIPVGIGRIVGDDRIIFLIKDIIVRTEYRGKGIGQMIMQKIMEYIRKNGCPNASAVLMAAPNTECFYEKLGFIRRPNTDYGAGMVQFIN